MIAAIKLLESIPSDDIELAFSGGKDSSVILYLAKIAGIMNRVTPIYKNTTIDPKGNVAFCRSQGCEVVNPKYNFFEIVAKKGFPSRQRRFCCEILKEYKIKDYAIIGVRKSESRKRKERYHEPEVCRIFGSKAKADRSNCVKHYMPILEWTDDDVEEFIKTYRVRVNPYYYDEYGNFDVTRRLGCMGCPLQSRRKLQIEFKQHPRLAKLWIKAGDKFLDNQRNNGGKTALKFKSGYELMFFRLFSDNMNHFYYQIGRGGLFEELDVKNHLEGFLKIKL